MAPASPISAPQLLPRPAKSLVRVLQLWAVPPPAQQPLPPLPPQQHALLPLPPPLRNCLRAQLVSQQGFRHRYRHHRHHRCHCLRLSTNGLVRKAVPCQQLAISRRHRLSRWPRQQLIAHRRRRFGRRCQKQRQEQWQKLRRVGHSRRHRTRHHTRQPPRGLTHWPHQRRRRRLRRIRSLSSRVRALKGGMAARLQPLVWRQSLLERRALLRALVVGLVGLVPAPPARQLLPRRLRPLARVLVRRPVPPPAQQL